MSKLNKKRTTSTRIIVDISCSIYFCEIYTLFYFSAILPDLRKDVVYLIPLVEIG